MVQRDVMCLMVVLGQGLLVASLVCAALSAILLFLSSFCDRVRTGVRTGCEKAGRVFTVVTFLLLCGCIAVLVYCFFVGDYHIFYVLKEHTNNTSDLSWLYRLSGLWAGAQGSLLLWTSLMEAFALVLAIPRTHDDSLMLTALAIIQIIVLAFICVLVFAVDENPFQPTPSDLLDGEGNLISGALAWSMNILLEHWAMAIHPPLLFIGYAGLVVPFSYALASLIIGDTSSRWVERSNGTTVFSWLFLGAGIGIGAIWAYAVLGWGGYWGWDPVENASLIPWLMGLALIHDFTLVRRRGIGRRWTVICTCLTFMAVIFAAFVTRSGLVQSVHAFEGDMLAERFFLAMLVSCVIVATTGMAIRWKRFTRGEPAGSPAVLTTEEGQPAQMESLLSREGFYYLGGIVLTVFSALLGYMTIACALPSWMPLGGQAFDANMYEAIARPFGIIYLFLLALCPLLSWGRTVPKAFWRRVRLPLIIGAVVFAGLVVLFVTVLLPYYSEALQQDTSSTTSLIHVIPGWAYNGLALIGLAVAALLIGDGLAAFIGWCRGISRGTDGHADGRKAALGDRARLGGLIAHLGMGVILVGLIGTSLYPVSETVLLDGMEGSSVTCEGYRLELTDVQAGGYDADGNRMDTVTFDLAGRDGSSLQAISPTIRMVELTQQYKLDASIVSSPREDLFVAYEGVDYDGFINLYIQVMPLVSLLWAGFGILMAGSAIAATARRGIKGR